MFKPGEAYQFDWSHEDVEIAGKPMRVKVAHMRLCASRAVYVRAQAATIKRYRLGKRFLQSPVGMDLLHWIQTFETGKSISASGLPVSRVQPPTKTLFAPIFTS